MLGLIGKKIGMMRLYDEVGEFIVVTVIKLGPCFIVQKKNNQVDGYTALQIGFEDKKEKNATKPLIGHCKKVNLVPKKILKEFRVVESELETFSNGKELNISDVFSVGQLVDISGVSKGKGFEGTIKRHNFNRRPMSHGGKQHRAPGSIGNRSFPGRVFKNKKMPGHMGDEQVTVQNLKIIKINKEENLAFVKGAIPGIKQGFVIVEVAVKKQKIKVG